MELAQLDSARFVAPVIGDLMLTKVSDSGALQIIVVARRSVPQSAFGPSSKVNLKMK
jgi:hypothetical protein